MRNPTQTRIHRPPLYRPELEKDNCGVGFLANVQGRKSNEVLQQPLRLLSGLTHRGAVGCDPNTGDGCGLLMQIPHQLFAEHTDFELPPAGAYGVGQIFLPSEPRAREQSQTLVPTVTQSDGFSPQPRPLL